MLHLYIIIIGIIVIIIVLWDFMLFNILFPVHYLIFNLTFIYYHYYYCMTLSLLLLLLFSVYVLIFNIYIIIIICILILLSFFTAPDLLHNLHTIQSCPCVVLHSQWGWKKTPVHPILIVIFCVFIIQEEAEEQLKTQTGFSCLSPIVLRDCRWIQRSKTIMDPWWRSHAATALTLSNHRATLLPAHTYYSQLLPDPLHLITHAWLRHDLFFPAPGVWSHSKNSTRPQKKCTHLKSDTQNMQRVVLCCHDPPGMVQAWWEM